MASIDGTCLCGAVTLRVARMPRSLTQCNCSVCRRYGTLWMYFKRRDLKLTSPRNGLRDFTRPHGELRFRHCATCGCVVSWEHGRGPDARMGINARLFDHAAMATVPIHVLDGDGDWKVVERYTKPAIWTSPTR